MKSIAIANLSILILTSTLMAQAPGWQPEKIPSFYPGNVAALKAYQNQDGEPVLGVISFDPTLQTYTVQVPYYRRSCLSPRKIPPQENQLKNK